MHKSNEFKAVKVSLGDRSYDVTIGAGLLASIQNFITDLSGQSAFILTDSNVKSYAETLGNIIGHSAASVHLMEVPPGESTKSFYWFEKVTGWMLDHTVTRKSVLFVVGGGVVGDLGGFAAATVLRGISFVQVPTTLLAMVDSSVGGKTAIDMPQGKNLVGAFHQPVAVISDTDVLTTLPQRELRAGYAEAVKHGALGDAAFFSWLEKHGLDVLALEAGALASFVETNCKIKAAIVKEDEKEAGRRALLNLGHTFGHALETAAGYSGVLLHGEAVAVGMILAAQLSIKLKFCDEVVLDRLQAHLKSVGLPVSIKDIAHTAIYNSRDLVQSMYGDKKAETGGLTFVLLKDIGDAFVQRRVSEEDVIAVLNQSMQGL